MQTEVIEEMQAEALEGFRLSPQQRHLWALQRDEQSAAFIMRCAVKIEGQLDTEILRAALQHILLSNEILRTTFKQLPGEPWPYQVVNSDARLSLYEIDLSKLGCDEQAVQLKSLFEDAAHPVADTHGSATTNVMNVRLAALSSSSHVLIISLPSLCADKATLRNLVSEITRTYDSLLKGEPAVNDPIQYIDLAEWQNDLLESEETNLGTMFWKDSIGGSRSLSLPSYFRKPAVDNSKFEPASCAFVVDDTLAHEIKALALEHEVSVAACLLACWQILFSRLYGQTSILSGVAFDGRRSQELENALGLFARHLPIKADFEEDPAFSEALSSAQASLSEAHKRQEYFSFEQSIEGASQISTFFPLCFEYEKQPAKYPARDTTFAITEQNGHFDKFVLKLTCLDDDEALKFQLHYDTGVMEAEDVERIYEQFEVLLKSACAQAETRVSRLSMLSEREREQILNQSREASISYPVDEYVHQMFERRAGSGPDNIAVVMGERRLSYGELNTKANQLAQRLRRCGVGPDVLVGILMARSLEMVVGLLAVLKAGGAYVPLDAAYPAERLAYMIEDAAVKMLLTQREAGDKAAGHAAEMVYVDEEWEAMSRESGENLASNVSAENLAYVIYTSGSTGKPKGVMIPHGGLANYLGWSERTYPLDRGDGVPVHSSLSFDLTITSLLSPLISGRTVHLLRDEQGIEALEASLREGRNFSLIKLTPSHLEVLNQHVRPAQLAGITQALIIGGEQLRADHLRLWREHAPETRLINEYGPTETVVGCCIHEVMPEEQHNGVIPIGRPIANTRLYVLDRSGELSSAGVSGELHVGGAGVARGYLGRADLTAEKFVPDVLSGAMGERLYRTGDLVRYGAGGNLEFIGRMDEQVKVRGYRVELGEIEAAMCAHHSIDEALVVLDENEVGDKRLVAYFISANASSIPADEMRDFLRRGLPEHMVPSLFIRLETIPLTPNGKIDRKALPSPNSSRPELAAPYLAPRTPLEKELVEVWTKSLGLERVGVNDHFFDLGGHSLIATQIVHVMRETYQIKIPLTFFFTNAPTIAALAASIEQEQIEEAEEEGLSAELEALDALSDEEVRALLGNA
jgi:amino acid adenylation domain-containing protein